MCAFISRLAVAVPQQSARLSFRKVECETEMRRVARRVNRSRRTTSRGRRPAAVGKEVAAAADEAPTRCTPSWLWGVLADMRAFPRSESIQSSRCFELASEIMLCRCDHNNAEMRRLMLEEVQLAMRRHPDSHNVQLGACRALRSLIHFDDAKVQAQRLDVMVEVQAAMRRHVSSVELGKDACVVALWLVEKDAAEVDVVVRPAELLRDLQGVMQSHVSQEDIQRLVCGIIDRMGKHNHGAAIEAGRMGLLTDIQIAMRAHKESEMLQAGTCATICFIVGRDNGNAAEAGRLCLLNDIQAAMRAHEGSQEVQRAACGAIEGMCDDNGNAVEVGRLGLLVDIQKALRIHASSKIICLTAGLIISAIVTAESENAVEAERLGLPMELQAAMRSHSGCCAMQYALWWAIFNIFSVVKAEKTWQRELLLILQSEMRAYPRSLEMQYRGCTIISKITHDDETCGEAARWELLSDVRAAMRHFLTSTELSGAPSDVMEVGMQDHAGIKSLQGSACEAICSLVSNVDIEVKAELVEALGDVQAAMRAYPDSPDVQKAACEAIWVLAYKKDEIRCVFGRLGLFVEIQAAMRVHVSSAKMQEMACGAIINVVADNRANWLEAKRLGLMTDVKKALVGHQSSEEVQLCGGLARLALNTEV